MFWFRGHYITTHSPKRLKCVSSMIFLGLCCKTANESNAHKDDVHLLHKNQAMNLNYGASNFFLRILC